MENALKVSESGSNTAGAKSLFEINNKNNPLAEISKPSTNERDSDTKPTEKRPKTKQWFNRHRSTHPKEESQLATTDELYDVRVKPDSAQVKYFPIPVLEKYSFYDGKLNQELEYSVEYPLVRNTLPIGASVNHLMVGDYYLHDNFIDSNVFTWFKEGGKPFEVRALILIASLDLEFKLKTEENYQATTICSALGVHLKKGKIPINTLESSQEVKSWVTFQSTSSRWAERLSLLGSVLSCIATIICSALGANSKVQIISYVCCGLSILFTIILFVKIEMDDRSYKLQAANFISLKGQKSNLRIRIWRIFAIHLPFSHRPTAYRGRRCKRALRKFWWYFASPFGPYTSFDIGLDSSTIVPPHFPPSEPPLTNVPLRIVESVSNNPQ